MKLVGNILNTTWSLFRINVEMEPFDFEFYIGNTDTQVKGINVGLEYLNFGSVGKTIVLSVLVGILTISLSINWGDR